MKPAELQDQIVVLKEENAELERKLENAETDLRDAVEALADLKTTLTSTEEELKASKEETRQSQENEVPDGWGYAVNGAAEAAKIAREALHRWKLGVNLKPTADDLAETIAQIVLDLQRIEDMN